MAVAAGSSVRAARSVSSLQHEQRWLLVAKRGLPVLPSLCCLTSAVLCCAVHSAVPSMTSNCLGLAALHVPGCVL
jgi:hypothetical protein